MDKTFEELFQPFFLKMAVLNYKILAKTPFNEEYQKIKRHLEVLIPIYDRLLEDKSISLTDILTNKGATQVNASAPEITIENLGDYPFISADSDTDIYTTAPLLQSSETSTTNSTTTVEVDVIDVEGDSLVKELHNKSLEVFKKLQEVNWVVIQEEDDNTDELVSDNDEEDENKTKTETTEPLQEEEGGSITKVGKLIDFDADDEYGEDDNDHENDKYMSDTGTTLGGNYNFYEETFNKQNYNDGPCMNIYM